MPEKSGNAISAGKPSGLTDLSTRTSERYIIIAIRASNWQNFFRPWAI